MPYRKDPFYAHQYYHVYNRGVNGGPVFLSDDHYAYLLRLLKRCQEPCGVRVIAYCLIPNHYHLMLRQEGEAPIGRYMQRVTNAYVQALNKEQGRRGPLFEGRFRHAHVKDAGYFTQLCRYIHLNPVKAGLCAEPGEWMFSNYREFVGTRQGTLVDRAFVAAYWPQPGDYAQSVREWVETPQWAAQVRGMVRD